MLNSLRLVIISLFSLVLVACSSSTKKNAQDVIDYDGETDYRKTENQLTSALDVPPDLLLQTKSQQELGFLLTDESAKNKSSMRTTLPSFQSDNVIIKSNLSERWLELRTIQTPVVWAGIQSLLISMGFEVAEERQDIGFIKTNFLKRTEIVPPSLQGPLTRLLNSWRPELAQGMYDRIVVRVEPKSVDGNVRVFFYHYALAEPQDAEGIDVGNDQTEWQVRPYNPMFEAEALYQAAIFFGSSTQTALQQIQMTSSFFETIDEEKELMGINFKASENMSWDYFVAMLYRAGWQVEEVNKPHLSIKVKLPKNVDELTHDLVEFKFKSVSIDGDSYSHLTVTSENADLPLSEKERKYLFQSLGLL